MCTGLLCPNVVCGGCQDESALNANTVYITLDATFLQTWNLSKILHSQIFRLQLLHRKSA